MRLIFLISLPRSGSTLLQKILSVNPEIYSTGEPWILLPLANMKSSDMVVSQYWQKTCSSAFLDWIEKLPGGKNEYNNYINEFACKIYQSLAKKSSAEYFLDKTPRYYLILPFIKEVFPNAKIIFLVRNPLDVFSSILKTWHRNFINPSLLANYIDLIKGPNLIAEGIVNYKGMELIVNYEKLITDPEKTLRDICEYLGINFQIEMLTEYKNIRYSGHMGDTVGINKYEEISRESLHKWKLNVQSPFRKWYMKRYINYLGENTLDSFGVEKDCLLNELEEIHVQFWKGWGELFGFIALRLMIKMNRAFISPPYNLNVRLLLDKTLMPYG